MGYRISLRNHSSKSLGFVIVIVILLLSDLICIELKKKSQFKRYLTNLTLHLPNT